MNTTEHLLVCLAEECAEITQDAMKALRFGLDDAHPKREGIPNRELIASELDDLIGVVEVLREKGIIRPVNRANTGQKKDRLAYWMKHAEKLGTLEAPPDEIVGTNFFGLCFDCCKRLNSKAWNDSDPAILNGACHGCGHQKELRSVLLARFE